MFKSGKTSFFIFKMEKTLPRRMPTIATITVIGCRSEKSSMTRLPWTELVASRHHFSHSILGGGIAERQTDTRPSGRDEPHQSIRRGGLNDDGCASAIRRFGSQL